MLSGHKWQFSYQSTSCLTVPHHVGHVAEGEVRVGGEDECGKGKYHENQPPEDGLNLLDDFEVLLLEVAELCQLLGALGRLLKVGDAPPDFAGQAVYEADKDEDGDAQEAVDVEGNEGEEDEGGDDVDAGEVGAETDDPTEGDEDGTDRAGGEEDEVMNEGTLEVERVLMKERFK